MTFLLLGLRLNCQVVSHYNSNRAKKINKQFIHSFKCRHHVPFQRSQHRKQFRRRADTKKEDLL